MRRDRKDRGFALVEAAALLAVAVAVAALLLLAAGDQRRLGRLGEDLGKLRRIGALTTQYAADNADLFWTFSWRGGVKYDTPWPELNFAATDGQAQINQAIYLLRSRANRPEIAVITGWFPHALYSHLVLAEFAQGTLPDPEFVSAADRHRLLWSRDPRGFDQGVYQPAPVPGPGTNAGKRWPYSASFTPAVCFFDRSAVPYRIYPASHSTYFLPGGAVFRGCGVSDIAYPSQKVVISDSHARHFGTVQPYCTHDQARLPLLMADAGVVIQSAAASNPGWTPNQPASASPMTFNYQPGAWEPTTTTGDPSEPVTGRFRWTRGGIEGRDFGGPEVCTGQPGCP